MKFHLVTATDSNFMLFLILLNFETCLRLTPFFEAAPGPNNDSGIRVGICRHCPVSITSSRFLSLTHSSYLQLLSRFGGTGGVCAKFSTRRNTVTIAAKTTSCFRIVYSAKVEWWSSLRLGQYQCTWDPFDAWWLLVENYSNPQLRPPVAILCNFTHTSLPWIWRECSAAPPSRHFTCY